MRHAAGAGASGAEALLAIDTSIGTTVALHSGMSTFEVQSSDERGHTEAIGGLIARVFEESGVSPTQVAAVIVGIGPGPFTGLRVGIAAAKAFATARGVPLLPLSGHEAVAYGEFAAEPSPASGERDIRAQSDALPVTLGPVRVLQDARRRELFVTEYSGLDEFGLPVLSSAPHLLARADYVEEPRDVWPEAIPASTLLWLAELRFRAQRDFEPDQALYLRAPDVKPAGAIKRVSA